MVQPQYSTPCLASLLVLPHLANSFPPIAPGAAGLLLPGHRSEEGYRLLQWKKL